MFSGAIGPLPPHARVGEDALRAVEQALGDDEESLQRALDRAYRDMRERHPELAEWLAERIADQRDEVVGSLGFFLVTATYMAFREAFGSRLAPVRRDALHVATETLDVDHALRCEDGSDPLDSDDVLAIWQPELVAFVHRHVAHVVQQAGDEIDLGELDRTYRMVLATVIAMSRAVRNPRGPSQATLPA